MNDAIEAAGLLAGKQIVVTRARRQAAGLEAVIRQFGAAPIAYPCIAIAPPSDYAVFDRCLRSLHEYDWLAFSSGNAVRALADRARALAVLPSLERIRIAALGPATQAELRCRVGMDADFVPVKTDAEALAREIPLGKRSRVLLPQSQLAAEGAARIMRRRGADVTTLVAYRTVMGSGGADVPALLTAGQIDALTFASPSAVRFFRQRCKLSAALELPALCLGVRTADVAASAGFRCVIRPPTLGLRAMIAAYADACAKPD